MPYTPSFPDLVARPPRNLSSLTVENEADGFYVSCHVRRVKHGLVEVLPTVYVTLPAGLVPRSFQVTYELHAGNVPDAISGTLDIVIQNVT